MKKFILYFILSFLPMVTFAQKDTSITKTKGIFKIYPLQAIVGEVRLGYEKAISKRLSIEVSPGFVYGIFSGETNGDLGPDGNYAKYPYRGFALRTGLKFYTSKKREHNGFYFSPLLLFKYVYHSQSSNNSSNLTQNIYMTSVQCLLGYKYRTRKGVNFEIYSGFGLKRVVDVYDFHNPKLSFNTGTNVHIYPTLQLGLAIGFQFKKK